MPLPEPFPRAAVNPSAAPWTRAVEKRISAAEQRLAATRQRLDQANRVIAAIKGRGNAGALTDQGDWTSAPIFPGFWIGNFDFNAVPEHAYLTTNDAAQTYISDSPQHVPFGVRWSIPWGQYQYSHNGGLVAWSVSIQIDSGDPNAAYRIEYAPPIGPKGILLDFGTATDGAITSSGTLNLDGLVGETPGDPDNINSLHGLAWRVFIDSTDGSESSATWSLLEFSALTAWPEDPTNLFITYASIGQGDDPLPTDGPQAGPVYQANDVVTYNGVRYLANGTTDRLPPDQSASWTPISGGPQYAGAWTP